MENLSWLISGSDFQGNPEKFKDKLQNFVSEKESQNILRKGGTLRIGVIGIPPMFTDIFDFIEQQEVKIVYNETAVEFGRIDLYENIIDNYHNYSYPYDLRFRLEKIKKEIKKREIDALIHYTQSFCFHNNEHKYIAENLKLPILHIENDKPSKIDESTKIRVESFINDF